MNFVGFLLVFTILILFNANSLFAGYVKARSQGPQKLNFFHSSNHHKYKILGGKTVKNLQFVPQTTEILVTLSVRECVSGTLVREKLSLKNLG